MDPITEAFRRLIPPATAESGAAEDKVFAMELLVSSLGTGFQEKCRALVERSAAAGHVTEGVFTAFAAIIAFSVEREQQGRVRMAASTLRIICQKEREWKAIAFRESLDKALIAFLLQDQTDQLAADCAFSLLASMLANRAAGDEVEAAHRSGATRACILHLAVRCDVIRLLSEMVRSPLACKHIFKRRLRTQHVLDHLLACLRANHDHKRFIAAVDAFCRLCDHNLQRVTSHLNVRDFAALVSSSLRGGMAVHAMRLQRSLLGRGITFFEGKRDEGDEDAAVITWAAHFGDGCVRDLVGATVDMGTDGVWRMFAVIAETLAQHSRISEGTARAVMTAVSQRLPKARGLFAHRLLHMSFAVASSADVDPTSHLLLVNACNNIVCRRGAEEVFRDKQFHHRPAPFWNTTDSCAICLERLEEGVQETMCKHVMHVKCLLTCLRECYPPRCPLCRDEGVDVIAVLLSQPQHATTPGVDSDTDGRRVRQRR